MTARASGGPKTGGQGPSKGGNSGRPLDDALQFVQPGHRVVSRFGLSVWTVTGTSNGVAAITRVNARGHNLMRLVRIGQLWPADD